MILRLGRTALLAQLKEKLQCDLHISWLRRASHPSEAGVVDAGDHTVGAKVCLPRQVWSGVPAFTLLLRSMSNEKRMLPSVD
jgi:hypothetical protein